MGGLNKTWVLLKQSFRVIRQDKELLWHMVFGSGAAIVILATAAVPMALTDYYTTSPATAAVLTAIAAYFANLVFTFFYVALIAGVLNRLEGGDPNVRSSLAVARKNIVNIIIWATITFIVGLILDAVRNNNRTRWVGILLSSLLGAAWELLTFLVEPIFIKEERSVFSSMKRSIQILRDTWGSQLGLRFATVVIYLGAAIIAGGLGFLIGLASLPAGITVGVLIGVPAMLFIKALSGVIKAVVYNYAINKTLPAEVQQEDLDSVLRTEQSG